MKSIVLVLLLAAFVLVSLPDAGAGPQDEPAAPTLEDIAWLAGEWRQGSEEGKSNEELWMPPRGGMMLGLNRTVRGGRAVAFEFLRIQQEQDGVVYYASPGGSPPTPFRLTQADASHATFENPEHDFPKRIWYQREGRILTASIGADEPGPSWTFELVGEVE